MNNQIGQSLQNLDPIISSGYKTEKENLEIPEHINSNPSFKGITDPLEEKAERTAKNKMAFNRTFCSGMKIAGLLLAAGFSTLAALLTSPVSLPLAIIGLAVREKNETVGLILGTFFTLAIGAFSTAQKELYKKFEKEDGENFFQKNSGDIAGPSGENFSGPIKPFNIREIFALDDEKAAKELPDLLNIKSEFSVPKTIDEKNIFVKKWLPRLRRRYTPLEEQHKLFVINSQLAPAFEKFEAGKIDFNDLRGCISSIEALRNQMSKDY